jgi:hypothetical protein
VWEKLADLGLLFMMAAVPLAFLGQEPMIATGLGLFGLTALIGLVVPQLLAVPLGSIGKLRPLAKAWINVLSALRARGTALPVLLTLTGLICCGHLIQIALMAAALGVSGPTELWITLIALFPVTIVAGLVPLTVAGVGIRDAALVLLLSSHIGAPTAAALGVLFWLRYLVPGVLGSPLLPHFLDVLHGHARKAFR